MNGKSFRVEYILLLSKKEPFCGTTEKLNMFLSSHSSIAIEKKHINYDGIKFLYDVQFGDILSENEIFFHIKLTCDENELDKFIKLNRIFKEALNKTEGKINVLWDDVGSYYSTLAYPIISDIENTMRKLIAKFMVTKLGSKWDTLSLPSSVTSSLSKKKGKKEDNADKDSKGTDEENSGTHKLSYVTEIHRVDFIDLSKFLFDSYHSKDPGVLYDKIRKIKKTEDVTIEIFDELRNLTPESNWTRYFSQVINFNPEDLKKNWEKLYSLRNSIAHNRFLAKHEYEELQKLCNKIKPILQQAIDELDKITISDEEKVTINNMADLLLQSYEVKSGPTRRAPLRRPNLYRILSDGEYVFVRGSKDKPFMIGQSKSEVEPEVESESEVKPKI